MTAATVDLADRLGVTRWILLGLLANPGVWLAVRLLTVDVLALALGPTGLCTARTHDEPVAIG